ncbi:MAG TPA: DNA polymerase/3'-5' exonuclease PolX [Actinomycetota bacterium]
MPRSNDAVEAALLEYAELLSITSSDPYKPRSYEKAARSIGGYHADVASLDPAGILGIPNVGKSIGDKVVELLSTGRIEALEELREQIPDGVRAMMGVPGLGPKKANVLYRELGISSVEQLLEALDSNRLEGLKGFGPKTEENIRRGVAQMAESGGRVLLSLALDVAEELLAEIRTMKQVRRAESAGSLRRMVETIGDIDLLVAADEAEPVMRRFGSLPAVARVLASGSTKSSIVTTKGLQVDLRVVEPAVWGAAMIYFTGSKAHNVRIREMAVRKGLKLSEYGLFRADDGQLIAAETEEAVYERLGLPFIPPTLREDRGEVEAALEGRLPDVLQQSQIRGDLHTHTNLTDGLAPLEEMLDQSSTFEYGYVAVTDHAPQLYMQRMTDEKMLAQRARLRELQPRYPKMTLLHGTELNIDPDGNVDWPEEFLRGFDVCVASVHSHLGQSKDEMTRRIVRAMENPCVHVIGHPTGRMIGKRQPVELDLDEVFSAAARTGTALEVNGFPDRLDLRDEHILWAKRHGVRFAVDTDAHAAIHLSHMRFGVATAQRGWLTKDEVINAWPLARLRRFLRKDGSAAR